MDILIGVLFLTLGAVGIFRPSFLYNGAVLTPEEASRNKRIWKRCGIALVLLGFADLIIVLLRH